METMFEINAELQPFPAKPFPDEPAFPDQWSDATDTGTPDADGTTLSSTLGHTAWTTAGDECRSVTSLEALGRYMGCATAGEGEDDGRSDDASLAALGRYMGCSACGTAPIAGRELQLVRGGADDDDDGSALTADDDDEADAAAGTPRPDKAAAPSGGDGGVEVRLEDTAFACPPTTPRASHAPMATGPRGKGRVAGGGRRVAFDLLDLDLLDAPAAAPPGEEVSDAELRALLGEDSDGMPVDRGEVEAAPEGEAPTWRSPALKRAKKREKGRGKGRRATGGSKAAEACEREVERRLSEVAADLRRVHREEVASLRQELREYGAQMKELREEVELLRGQLIAAQAEDG